MEILPLAFFDHESELSEPLDFGSTGWPSLWKEMCTEIYIKKKKKSTKQPTNKKNMVIVHMYILISNNQQNCSLHFPFQQFWNTKNI